MTNLTDTERELVVQHFFQSETAYLVEMLMDYLPEDMLKQLGERLAKDAED